jgi:hypothetical protein
LENVIDFAERGAINVFGNRQVLLKGVGTDGVGRGRVVF